MKAFNRIFAVVIILIIAVFVIANVIMLTNGDESGRPYRVEISRLVAEIEKDSLEIPDLANCKYVTGVLRFEDTDNFYNAESDYVIREINGELYRFDYRAKSEEDKRAILTVNVILGIMAV